MEHAEHLLVLDAGGGGERCHIFTARGDLVASAYRPWEFFIPRMSLSEAQNSTPFFSGRSWGR